LGRRVYIWGVMEAARGWPTDGRMITKMSPGRRNRVDRSILVVARQTMGDGLWGYHPHFRCTPSYRRKSMCGWPMEDYVGGALNGQNEHNITQQNASSGVLPPPRKMHPQIHTHTHTHTGLTPLEHPRCAGAPGSATRSPRRPRKAPGTLCAVTPQVRPRPPPGQAPEADPGLFGRS